MAMREAEGSSVEHGPADSMVPDLADCTGNCSWAAGGILECEGGVEAVNSNGEDGHWEASGDPLPEELGTGPTKQLQLEQPQAQSGAEEACHGPPAAMPSNAGQDDLWDHPPPVASAVPEVGDDSKTAFGDFADGEGDFGAFSHFQDGGLGDPGAVSFWEGEGTVHIQAGTSTGDSTAGSTPTAGQGQHTVLQAQDPVASSPGADCSPSPVPLRPEWVAALDQADQQAWQRGVAQTLRHVFGSHSPPSPVPTAVDDRGPALCIQLLRSNRERFEGANMPEVFWGSRHWRSRRMTPQAPPPPLLGSQGSQLRLGVLSALGVNGDAIRGEAEEWRAWQAQRQGLQGLSCSEVGQRVAELSKQVDDLWAQQWTETSLHAELRHEREAKETLISALLQLIGRTRSPRPPDPSPRVGPWHTSSALFSPRPKALPCRTQGSSTTQPGSPARQVVCTRSQGSGLGHLPATLLPLKRDLGAASCMQLTAAIDAMLQHRLWPQGKPINSLPAS